MVAICEKCKKLVGCLDKFQKEIYLCIGCEFEDSCNKDREEFALPVICHNCQEMDKQLEFDFPED